MFSKKALRLVALMQVLLFGSFLVGCGKSKEEKAQADSTKGDAAMSEGRPIDAMDSYRKAYDEAKAADDKAKKNGGSYDTKPFEAKILEAQKACADRAKAALEQAKGLTKTDPYAAQRALDDAERYARDQYGNVPEVRSQIAAVYASPEMAPVRMIREMDLVTDRINNWLFMRSLYSQDPNNWGSYFRISAYVEMENQFAVLDQHLREWSGGDSGRAQGQLSAMKSSFDSWRLVAQLSPEATQAQGYLLINFLQKHAELKATLHGTRDINYWQLQDSWGISGTGSGGLVYTGTGNGGTGNGTGTGTGNGGTGTGNGGTGTGNGGTGFGTGTGTGSGTGTGTGNGTGSGTGTGSGRGTGTGRGTGSGTGTGTGTGTGGPGFDDLPRSGGTGTGTGGGRSSGTGTGTGGGFSGGTGTGTGGGRSGGTGTGTGTGR